MAAGEDVMPLPQLPGTVGCALLVVDADSGAAVWTPLARVAVRRTQHRLFLLFTGSSLSAITGTPSAHLSLRHGGFRERNRPPILR